MDQYYRNAQIRLIKIIGELEAKGSSTAYRQKLLDQVNAELKALDKYSKEWAENTIPKEYLRGAGGVYEYLKKEIPPDIISRNQEAVNVLIQNCLDDFSSAQNYVGRLIKDEIRKAGITAATQKVLTGSTLKEMKRDLVESLSNRGINAIKDKLGREIHLDAYASMVARTTVREATNLGCLNEMEELDNDLVQFSSHASACPICAPIEGRVFSISGRDKRYPPLSSAFRSGYHTLHPNCVHVLTPYVEKFDSNAGRTRSFSNSEYKPDKSSLDRYYAQQEANRKRLADRRQWEKYKLLYPDETPSFSGFRAMKAAKSERYRTLISKPSAAPVVVRKTPVTWGDSKLKPELKSAVENRLDILQKKYPLSEENLNGVFDAHYLANLERKKLLKQREDIIRKIYPEYGDAQILSMAEKQIKSIKISTGTGGYFNPYDKNLSINTRAQEMALSWDDAVKSRLADITAGKTSYNIGWGIESVVTHEYGHAVYHALPKDKQLAIDNLCRSLTQKEISQNLSTYAATNSHEMFAEAFLDSFMPNPSSLTMKIIGLMGGLK